MLRPAPARFGLFVYIDNPAHGTTVNSHPKLQARMFLQRSANLRCALGGRFWTRVKYQRHPIAGRDPDQTVRGSGSLKLLGPADDLV
jgi:hypothetical protein